MLGNTLTLPLSGGNVVLTKVNQDAYSGEYALRTSTLVWRAFVRHSVVKANGAKPAYDRHNFEVMKTTLAAGDVPEYYQKFYFVLELKPGDTSIELADGIADLMIATSNAFMTSLVQWES
jgi:hypothetical protein